MTALEHPPGGGGYGAVETLAGSQNCVAGQRACEPDSPKCLKSGCTIQVVLAVAHDGLNLVVAHSIRRLQAARTVNHPH